MLAVGLVVLPYDRTVVPTASDEPHYLIVAQSLVLDHDLDLANDYAGTRYLEFYPEKLPDIHGIVVGNAIYSIRDLGLPLLAVVPFAIAGRTGVMAMLCLAGALLAIQLYLMLRDLRFDRRVAFLAVAVTALVHPILTYTTQIYPDLIAALVFVSAARLMRRGMLASMRDLALASALTGTLPWLSTRAWFIAVGIGLVIAYCALWPRRDLLRRIAAGALPFAALVLALAYLNWREFGLFIPSAGYFLLREQQPVLVYTPWIGGIGLIFTAPRSPRSRSPGPSPFSTSPASPTGTRTADRRRATCSRRCRSSSRRSPAASRRSSRCAVAVICFSALRRRSSPGLPSSRMCSRSYPSSATTTRRKSAPVPPRVYGCFSVASCGPSQTACFPRSCARI